jgi:hypothetical protein
VQAVITYDNTNILLKRSRKIMLRLHPLLQRVCTSVSDPDPHSRWPPGSGTIFRMQIKEALESASQTWNPDFEIRSRGMKIRGKIHVLAHI